MKEAVAAIAEKLAAAADGSEDHMVGRCKLNPG